MTNSKTSLSIGRRIIRSSQLSLRRFDNWLMDKMPGIENSPEVGEEFRKPKIINLWELSWQEHKKLIKEAIAEYKASFSNSNDMNMAESAKEVRAVANKFKQHVSHNITSNTDYAAEKLEGTQLLSNVKEMRQTAQDNVEFVVKEMEGVDKQAAKLVKDVQKNVNSIRSDKSIAHTVSDNVQELKEIMEETRDKALSLEEKDMEVLKQDAQGWLADKLIIGQSVISSFIDGYKEGKSIELNRDESLILSVAKKTATQQSEFVQEKINQFIKDQKVAAQEKKKNLEKKESNIDAQKSNKLHSVTNTVDSKDTSKDNEYKHN